jgi:hypothetical protein
VHSRAAEPRARRVGGDRARTVLHSQEIGRFDAELFLDGKAARPDMTTAAVVILHFYELALTVL